MTDLFAMKTPSGQLDPLKWKYPTLVQPKLDGLRGICIKDSAHGIVGCRWFSFTGKPLWNLENVSASLPKGDCAVYDGEIIWPGHPFSDAYGLCKRQTSNPETVRQAAELRFHCFDRLELGEWSGKSCFRAFDQRLDDLMNAAYGERSGLAMQVMGVDSVESPEDLERMYQLYLAAGHEGLMAKRPQGRYYWTRHADWHRYKPTVTHDVEVLGAYEEFDKNGVAKGTLGGVIVRVPAEDGFPESICKVGGGFKAAERKKWWKPDWTIKWDLKWPKVERAGGSPLVGQMIEVESKCRQPKSGALREPHFVRLREDK